MEEVNKILKEYEQDIKQGTQKGVKELAKTGQELVTANCYKQNILNHAESVELKKINDYRWKVFTKNDVLIYNELGTGIRGSQNPHPDINSVFGSWRYDINNHGEGGWIYYNKEYGYSGWTKGLPSRHMFYDAKVTLEKQSKNILVDFIDREVK